MDFSVHVNGSGWQELVQETRTADRGGLRTLWSTETDHDPFLPLPSVAAHSRRIGIGTAVAVAFARSPMATAMTAWELQALSEGRFRLGLGSQTRAHVERRFSMPFDHPAARMNDYILALRAIWRSWATGEPLDHHGAYWSHTLMTPEFTPPAHPWEAPPVLLAAVGPSMTAVAGQSADGLLMHSFTTVDYAREVTLQALGRGLDRSSRDLADVSVVLTALVATGSTDQEIAEAREACRRQVAFYGSTPAYRLVLDRADRAELGRELHALSTTTDPDRWARMADLVDDDVLDRFAPSGTPAEVCAALAERWGTTVDEAIIYTPYPTTARTREEILSLSTVQVPGRARH